MPSEHLGGDTSWFSKLFFSLQSLDHIYF